MRPVPTDDQVRIVDFPETPVAVLDHRGDPALIGDTVRRFIAWRKRAGLRPPVSATFNILQVDPEDTAPEEYRLDLCAATERAVPLTGESITAGLIPAGRCAVLRVTGASDDLGPAIAFLYADWLSRRGEEFRGFPLHVQRMRFFPDVAENEGSPISSSPSADARRRPPLRHGHLEDRFRRAAEGAAEPDLAQAPVADPPTQASRMHRRPTAARTDDLDRQPGVDQLPQCRAWRLDSVPAPRCRAVISPRPQAA